MRFALTVALGLLTTVAHAAPPDPGRVEVARALAIDVAQVDAVQTLRLASGEGLYVGRYHALVDGAPAALAYPVVVVTAPCPKPRRGRCVYPVRLGSAAKRVAAFAFVDLDAPKTELTQLWSAGFDRTVEVLAKARWPALIVVSEVDVPDTTRSELAIVSLRGTPTRAPSVVFRTDLEERRRDWTDAELQAEHLPAGGTIGQLLSGLVLTHAGAAHTIVATIQPLDSRTNGCLRTKPYEATFVYADERFVEVPGTLPSRPCH